MMVVIFFNEIDQKVCNLKFGTFVFREPYDGCLCSCGEIAKTSVIFANLPFSLINYSVIF